MVAANYEVDSHPEVMDCRFSESDGDFEAVDSGAGSGVSTEDSEGDIPLQRTQSQVTKQRQVGCVVEHISERQAMMQDLQRVVSTLAEQGSTKEAAATATAAQKQARNIGEDLMEDMLSLDSLSNLFSEDRTARKRAISDIESLLSDVDTAKAQLSKLQKRLEAELPEDLSETKHGMCPQERQTFTSQDMDASEMKVDNQTEVSNPEQSLFAVPPAPGRKTWEQQPLSLQFHSREQRHCYVVEASAPGLDVQELKLRLDSDGSTLVVEGVCLPTASQKATMRRMVAMKLQQFAQRAPKQFAELGGAPGLSPEAYAKLSQGSFGRFSQSFSIPSDVAISNIDASYEDGKLMVVFPRRLAAPSSSPYQTYLQHRPYHTGPFGARPMAPGNFPAFQGGATAPRHIMQPGLTPCQSLW